MSEPVSRGRVALVTGAGSGIGRAIARRLAAEGCSVAAADINLDGARATSAGAPGSVSAFEVDVADQASVEAVVTDVAAAIGPPSVLVNCAGWDEFHPFLDTDRPFWERIVAVNYLGVVAVSHVVVPLMIETGGGRIVNIASDAGRVGSTGEAVYAGAKGGVIAFSKSLARELALHSITVNAVCPGPSDTPLFQAFPERVRQSLQRAIPLGRLAEPDDVAHAVSFFASAGAAYVTGQVLSVSGGLTMSG